MAETLHDPRYKRLIELLVSIRQGAGLTQRDVAKRLKRTPSYIGKLESRQRRLDVLELLDLLEVLGVEPGKFMSQLVTDVRKRR